MNNYDDDDDRYLSPAERKARGQERKRLHNLSIPELKEMYDKRVKDLMVTKLEQAEKEVLEELQASLKAVVASAIGCRKDTWGRWEVDTRNDCATANQIGKRALEMVEKQAPEILEQLFTPRTGPYTKLKAAIETNIVNYCHKYAAEAVKRGVEDQAQAKVDALLKIAGIGTEGENDP